MGIDLEQFHDAFFDESLEALAVMESSLLKVDVEKPDREIVNTVFRGAHSVKGGAAMFGFTDIASFTHTLETLLDELRSGRARMQAETADVLLRSVDVLRDMLQARRQRRPADAPKVAEAQRELERAVAQKGDSAAPAPQVRAARRGCLVSVRPGREMLRRGQDALSIIEALGELGASSTAVSLLGLPPLEALNATECYLTWDLRLDEPVTREKIEEVLQWVAESCEFAIEDATPERPAAPQGPAALQESTGLQERAAPEEAAASPSAGQVGPGDLRAATEHPAPAAGADSSSIRVGVEKIDELINTVGEIVITQSMLAQLGTHAEGASAERLRIGLAQLERNVRELHESVMRIRMLPIGFAFSRFPRLVRDLAQKLGKQIELRMTGEQTELDKTVLERIGDPLVHLVRNCIDHGIELPAARAAAGKPAAGTLHLAAFQRGSAIIIEVGDDGQGLDTDRILAKARAGGLVGAAETPTPEAVHELIFLPGLSTAERTTDLSGRGVGMDVVRRNVKALGGQIELRSERGRGSRFVITLPLTLAIVDGQSVCVGAETYIVPLVSIIESLQVKPGSVSSLSGAADVFGFRGDYLPLIRLHEVFGVEPRARSLQEGLVVVAEGDGQRVGLFVDDLRGQQQVVIKSLETHYGHVPGVSGATILGDGSVALILDVPGLIRSSAGRAAA